MNVPGSMAEIDAMLAMTMQRGKLVEEVQALFALFFRPEQTVEELGRVVATYVEDLQDYPRWALEAAFAGWRRTRTRRPTIAELRILADRETEPFRKRRAALKREAAARLEPPRPEITEDERRRRAAVLAELVGTNMRRMKR